MFHTTEQPYVWIIAAAVLAIFVLGIASYVLFRLLSKHWIRRSVMHLIGYRERITASRRTLEAVVNHLVCGDESVLVSFASDSADDNRRALSEIGTRMLITRDELDVRRFHPLTHKAAEELADVAHLIAMCALTYEAGMSSDEILDALPSVDLKGISEQYQIADAILVELCIAYDVDESVVYGGGLYI